MKVMKYFERLKVAIYNIIKMLIKFLKSYKTILKLSNNLSFTIHLQFMLTLHFRHPDNRNLVDLVVSYF